jgi:hypothetical protein
VVDSGATVRDSVILPCTYVGALVDVGNAIVATNYLMRVDTGAVLKVSDAFLLSNVGTVEGAAPISLLNRLAGMSLMILSLPLWPVAAVAAKLSGDGPLLESREFLGNRRSMLDEDDAAASIFIARNWRTRIPVLRNLPRLLAVARGDLRLVGVAPLTPTQAAGRTEDWQRVRDQVPVGLLGPTQLNLAEDAPLEERLLSDAFYAKEHGWQKDLKYLWQGLKMLFRAEGWRSGR